MKIVISETPPHYLDLDAPTLSAVEVLIDGRILWRIWCRYCRGFHYHGPGEGHREAHCHSGTPYDATGYNLASAGDVGNG
jgi:hypothetical protein